MASEYKVGMVAKLLGGGESSSGGELANFFSSPSKVTSSAPSRPMARKSKKKDDIPTAKTKKSLPKKKLQAQNEQEESGPKSTEINEEEENGPNSSEISHRSSGGSDGFRPPPGIVHEALTSAGKKPGSKRKKSSAADDEEDGVGDEKRPRRDRQKKINEKRTVFVGNVPLTTNKKKLTKLFQEFGEIESVRFRCAPVADPTTRKRVAVIKKEFHEQRNNISSYICFKEEESAKKALSLNGYLIDGLHIRVDAAKPKAKHETKRSVFVGNLPFAIEEESIRSHFEDCGEIENVRVIRDRKTNLGKGFCYILFESKDSVSLALKLHNSTLNGRALRVQRCVDPSKGDEQKGPKKKKSKYSDGKPTTADRKPKTKNKTWQPTNISKAQVLQLKKTALNKKRRQADKKKAKKNKADEVTRVLGPMQRPPAKTGTGKKSKMMTKKKKAGKGSKVARKGSQGRR